MLQDALLIGIVGAVEAKHHIFRAGDDAFGYPHAETTGPHIGDGVYDACECQCRYQQSGRYFVHVLFLKFSKRWATIDEPASSIT